MKNLIPPAPALPSCDAPGTQGRISPYTAQGNPVYELGTMTIMGSGNTVHSMGISGNIHLTPYTGSLRRGERHISCWHTLPRKRPLRPICELSRSVIGRSTDGNPNDRTTRRQHCARLPGRFWQRRPRSIQLGGQQPTA